MPSDDAQVYEVIADPPLLAGATHEIVAELELMAVKLWWQTFGKPSMSSDNDKVYMSEKLNEYTDKLIKLNTK